MTIRKTVAIGLSGGVDSSVAALLLKQQGYSVVGLFMKNWEETGPDGVCRSAADYDDVARVCKQIDIPYYTVNFVKEYWDEVFSQFLQDLREGHTPNPDILCNREIKFKHFLNKALRDIGADYLATGHYCRIDQDRLLRGLDSNKDQSYFLYTLKQHILSNVLFPIGHLQKAEVRQIAAKNNLCTSAKKDSTGICFIGKRDFKDFLSQYLPLQPGYFMTPEGKILGQHCGVPFYTIGQRKGLGIGGAGDAWFVASKDKERNIVFVVQGEDHPALYNQGLTATEVSWVEQIPPQMPLKCTAKIRYRAADAACTLTEGENGSLQVLFDTPQKAVTPRQAIVFYDGERCLGGGLIKINSL